MKSCKFFLLTAACAFISLKAASQNILFNIVTQNAGIITKGGTIFLELTVCNTDGADSVQSYKLRPQVSIPGAFASVSATGHKLPEGWAITFNDGTTVRLSNGTDNIPANACRVILIQIRGNKVGGPSAISGNMFFSNGVAPGAAAGTPTARDNPADNISTTTCQVTR